MIQCHDWSLEGYSVTDYGRPVTLHLIRNDLGPPITRLNTIFRGVALYHFVHTHATIILDIEEIPVEKILEQYSERIVEWHRLYGVSHWPKSIEGYANMLKEKGCQGWIVCSSMGFEGFIFGEAVSQSPG